MNPGEVGRVKLSDLSVDPKRFQYKMNTDAAGATNKLKDTPWNDELAGTITAWKDPADGKTYVINDHHRYALARSKGVDNMAVKMLGPSYKTAADARVGGALQNIAEGNGTATDAAKFMREADYSPEAMKNYGVSLSGPLAEGGAALSKLAPKFFDDVAAGRIPEQRGIAIAKAAPTPETQEALISMIRKAEGRGKSITNETIDELGRLTRQADTVSTQTDSLFGPESRTRNTVIERAEVSSFIRKRLAQEKNLFGGLTNTAKADTLGGKGNVINTEMNKRVADNAAQHQEVYDKLSTRTGPVDDILRESAKRLAEKDSNGSAIKPEAYAGVRNALGKALAGSVAADR